MSATDKIIITSDEIASSESSVAAKPVSVQNIPLWWRLLSVLLVLLPPVLFLAAIGGLVKVRHRDLSVRHAHALHYCCLLLASGILWTLLLLGLALWTPRDLLDHVADSSPISLQTFPALPSTTTLSGRDIARQLSPLVVVVHKAESSFIPQGSIRQLCGSGAVAFAGRDGCLVVTSRHVVDAIAGTSCLGRRLGVTLQDGQRAGATVVGVHRILDLALLWVPREVSPADFAQPLRSFRTVEVGEQVFVIGHPEGLEFSLSGGLVAQTRGEDLVQISAPVSPGNSGGPVYDTHGRLLAVVQSVIDKTKNPNAENLNFAVRADDLLATDAWTLLKEGQLAIIAFANMNRQSDREQSLQEGNDQTNERR
jgi:S1-C subfamily serine protease